MGLKEPRWMALLSLSWLQFDSLLCAGHWVMCAWQRGEPGTVPVIRDVSIYVDVSTYEDVSIYIGVSINEEKRGLSSVEQG